MYLRRTLYSLDFSRRNILFVLFIIIASFFLVVPLQVFAQVSVQSANFTMTTASHDITIDEINPANTFIRHTARVAGGNHVQDVTVEIIDSTTLRFTRYSAASNVFIEWMVIEDSAAQVQRGTTTVATGESIVTQAIDSVDLSQTFLNVTSRTNNSADGNVHQGMYAGYFSAADEITFERLTSGSESIVAWEVVTISDAEVQSGTTTLSGTSQDISLDEVELDNTFVSITSSANSSALQQRHVLADTVNSDTLRLERTNGTNSVLVSWHVVTVPRYAVQKVDSGYVSTQTIDQTIDEVDLGVTWIVGSSRNAGTGTSNSNSKYTTSLPNATTWRRVKQSTSQNTQVIGYVIEISPLEELLLSGTLYQADGVTPVGAGEEVVLALPGEEGTGTLSLSTSTVDAFPGFTQPGQVFIGPDGYVVFLSAFDSQRIHLYKFEDDELVRLANPTALPGNAFSGNNSGAWHEDTFIAVHEGGHQISYYQLDGDELVRYDTGTLPGAGRGIVNNGEYFAISYESDGLSLYELVDGELIHRHTPTRDSSSRPEAMDWSGDYLAVVNETDARVELFSLDREEDELVLLDSRIDRFAPRSLAWSGDYFLVAYWAAAESDEGVQLYRRDGDEITRVISSGIVTGEPRGMAWNGNYVAIGTNNTFRVLEFDSEEEAFSTVIEPVSFGSVGDTFTQSSDWVGNDLVALLSGGSGTQLYYQTDFGGGLGTNTFSTVTDSSGAWSIGVPETEELGGYQEIQSVTLASTSQPGGEGVVVAWDDQGEYVVVGLDGSIRLYELNVDELVFADSVSISNVVQHISWNGDFIVASHIDGNYLSLFKLDRGNDSISLIHTPTAPPDKSFAHAWNGNILAVGTSDWASGDGQNLTLYELDPEEEELNRLTDPTPAAGGVGALAWNGNLLAVGMRAANVAEISIELYELDGTTLTKLPFSIPSSDFFDVASLKWFEDFLVVKNSLDNIVLFELVGSDLEERQSISLPARSGNPNQRHMTWFENFLAVPHAAGDHLYLYELIDSQLVEVDVDIPTLDHRGFSAAWSPNGRFLVVGASDPADFGVNSDLYLLEFEFGTENIVPVIIYTSDSTFDATTLLQGANSASTRQNIPLVADTVRVHGTTTPVSLTDFSFFDSSNDAGVLYTMTDTTFTALGDFVIPPGVTVVTPDNLILTADLISTGILNAATTTVTLTGTNQQLISTEEAVTFGSLIKTVTASSTLSFSRDYDWIITNDVILTGSTGELLSLRGVLESGPRWRIDVGGTTTLQYLDVQDSNNISSFTFICEDCIDRGNNTGWSFDEGTASSSPARTPSPLDVRQVHSGHSLTDAAVFAGTWPGHYQAMINSIESGAADVWKSTIPGSPLWWRRENVSSPSSEDAWTNIADRELLVITENALMFPESLYPSGWQAEAREERREDFVDWVERATVIGNDGEGAEVLWYTNWPGHDDFSPATSWRARLEANEVEWLAVADYAIEEVEGVDEIFIIPGTVLMMRLWDDAEAGIIPGITDGEDFLDSERWWEDDVHPDGLGNLALGYLTLGVVHHIDPRTVSATGWGLIPEPTAAEAEYIQNLVWDILNTYVRAGFIGSEVDPEDPGEPPVISDIFFTTSNSQVFSFEGDPVSLGDVSIVEGLTSASITTENDMRIRIATSTIDMRFDTSITSVTVSGTASSKVENTVTYEEDDTVVVITVTEDFVPEDTLTIGGLQVGSFNTVSSEISRLILDVTDGVEISGGTSSTPTLTDLTLASSTRPGNDVYTVAWDSEGEYVVIGIDNNIRLYKLVDNELVFTDSVPGPYNVPHHLSFSGDFIAASYIGGNYLQLLKLNRGDDSISLVHTPTAPPEKSWSHAWNGNFLAVGTSDWVGGDGQNLTLYELDPVEEELTRLTDPTPVPMGVLALDWNGDILAVGGGNTFNTATQKLYLYELDGSTLTKLDDPTDSTNYDIYSLKWGGDFLAVKDRNNSLTLYELVTGDLVERQSILLPSIVGGPQRHMTWFNNYLAVPHGVGDHLYLYELIDGQLEVVDVAIPTLAHRGVSADWSPDGQYLVVGGSNADALIDSDLYLLDVSLTGGGGGGPIESVTTFIVAGNMHADNHSSGQVSNQFSFQNVDDAPIFGLRLSAQGESVTINQIRFSLDGAVSLLDRISNFRVYQDNDNSRTVTAGDTLLAENALITTIGSVVRVSFIESFIISEGVDLLLVADILHPSSGSSMTVTLDTDGLFTSGQTSGISTFIFSDITSVMHNRSGGGGGSVGVRFLETEVITGGSGDGGGAINPGDGDSLLPEPGYFAPQSTGAVDNAWTTPQNAYSSDNTYATADTEGQAQTFGTFSFGIPSGNTVTGVVVRLESSASTEAGSIAVALSWDGGATFTGPLQTTTLTTLDAVYTLGGHSNTWGRTWSVSDFANENFKVRIIANPDSNLIRVDALQVRPVHQATGGSGGGGGAI